MSFPFAYGAASPADSGSIIEVTDNNVETIGSSFLDTAPGALNLDLRSGFAPETLTLTPGKNTSEIGVTWYSEDTVGNGKVKFGDVTVNATSGTATTGKKWHKATVTGLTAGTVYVYSVSNDGTEFSQEYAYTTPGAGEFTFVAVGDPQLTTGNQDGTSNWFSSDRSTRLGWAATVEAMQTKLGDKLNFIAGVGDQVDQTNVTTANETNSENEYKNFFGPDLLRNVPFAPAVGNHDRHYGFTYHYNLPNEQTYDALQGASYGNATNAQYAAVEAKGNYYYTYNNALFVVLNDSSYPQSTTAAEALIANFNTTLAQAIAVNPNYTWLFVQHHKSTASVADHIADRDIQYYVEAGFERLMDTYKVDFVLGGHDHVYARSFPMKNGTPDITQGGTSIHNPNGTIYTTFTTASGLKYYELFNAAGNLYVKDNEDYPYLVNGLQGSVEYAKGNLPLSNAKYLQAKKPAFTAIKVTEASVTFETYNVDDLSNSYDTFQVTKTTEQIAELIEKIDLIPAALTLADKTKVTEARTAYDALTAEEKELVTNFAKLVAAETTIAALESTNAGSADNIYTWNVPTHGQADVTILGGSNELEKFEFMFDAKRLVDLKGTDEWLEDWRKEILLPRGNKTHNHALTAVGYLNAKFPLASAVLPDIKAD
ncbi:MAG: metallophosphoesterase family protein, partial [Oscillospiraceae bacterium]|nr:metallophosphoesterase family protein [Oscillospiraceae bacterium]